MTEDKCSCTKRPKHKCAKESDSGCGKMCLKGFEKGTASITITPEHKLYHELMRYTAEGMRMKLDEGEFSVTGFEMQGDNLVIWLRELEI